MKGRQSSNTGVASSRCQLRIAQLLHWAQGTSQRCFPQPPPGGSGAGSIAGLPRLEPGSPAPRCLATVLDGRVLYADPQGAAGDLGVGSGSVAP